MKLIKYKSILDWFSYDANDIRILPSFYIVSILLMILATSAICDFFNHYIAILGLGFFASFIFCSSIRIGKIHKIVLPFIWPGAVSSLLIMTTVLTIFNSFIFLSNLQTIIHKKTTKKKIIKKRIANNIFSDWDKEFENLHPKLKTNIEIKQKRPVPAAARNRR